MITQEELKELLHYDPETGLFTWRAKKRFRKAGSIAGGLTNGYIIIKLNGHNVRAHRLAFLYMTGAFPTEVVDHINMVKHDNRWVNLRHATFGQNRFNIEPPANNTSGFLGVTWHKPGKKWCAQIWFEGKKHYLGLFNTAELASNARNDFARKHHGEFFRES
jgi:hypothetical protein